MTNDVNSPAKWENDYQRGSAGWDMGTPTPVFQRLLAEKNSRGKKSFPPGKNVGVGLACNRHRQEKVHIPPAEHPWRKFKLNSSKPQPCGNQKRTFLLCRKGGHFNLAVTIETARLNFFSI